MYHSLAKFERKPPPTHPFLLQALTPFNLVFNAIAGFVWVSI